MRTLILLLGFALAACGSDQAADNAVVSEDSGGADVTAVNDLTAIDAATGDSANMAADVNYSYDELGNEGGNAADGNESGNKAP